MFILGLFVVRALAADAPAPAPAPRITFEKKDIDFGKVVVGTIVEQVFKFKNTGTAKLEVRRVKPSCSCTAALTSRPDLAPGESGEITVHFDTGDRQGYQTIEVDVFTNDAAEQDSGDCASKLVIHGEVAHFLDVMPFSFYVPSMLRGEPNMLRVSVLPREAGTAVHALSVDASAPWLQVSTQPIERGPKKGFEVVLVLAKDAPLGPIDEHVIVKTDHPKQPSIKLLAFGLIHGKVVLFPERLQVGTTSHDKEPAIQLMRIAGDGPIAIESVEAPPELVPEVIEVVPGKRSEIALHVRPTARRGPFSGVVRIFFRDPEQPLAEVVVTGEIARKVKLDPPGAWLEAPSATASVVRVSGGKALAAAVEGAPVTATVEEGRLIRLAIAPGAKPGPFAGTVHLTTDVAGEEKVDVPVRGVAR